MTHRSSTSSTRDWEGALRDVRRARSSLRKDRDPVITTREGSMEILSQAGGELLGGAVAGAFQARTGISKIGPVALTALVGTGLTLVGAYMPRGGSFVRAVGGGMLGTYGALLGVNAVQWLNTMMTPAPAMLPAGQNPMGLFGGVGQYYPGYPATYPGYPAAAPPAFYPAAVPAWGGTQADLERMFVSQGWG